MPIMFIVALVSLFTTVILAVMWLNQPKPVPQSERDYYRGSQDSRRQFRLATQVAFAVTLVLLALSALTMVSTKTVGVVTSFGKPSGEPLSNGLHVKAPWKKVHEFDAAKQVDEYTGDNCVTVRMAGQTTACVSSVVTWRIVPGEANTLYQDYKDFDRVRTTLVENNVRATLSKVFSDYNPLEQVANGKAVADTPDVSGYAPTVMTELQQAVGTEIEIVSVTTPYIKYDDTTQSRVNDLQAEVANTRIAEQKKLTAQAEAAANRELAASVSNDPNVLVSKCLDMLSTAAQAGLSFPNGFSCWPGTSVPVAIGPSSPK